MDTKFFRYQASGLNGQKLSVVGSQGTNKNFPARVDHTHPCNRATASTTGSTTVSSLPAATGNIGLMAYVTDSTVAEAGNYGVAVVGGGANFAQVHSNGTAWVIG